MSDAQNQLETEEARALIQNFHSALEQIRGEVRKVIVGQDEVVEHLLLTLLVGGHCLITGMPGTAKTLLVRTLAVALGLTFKRDSDDTRDSLAYKLVRMLERELAHVARHDPHVAGESEPLDSVLDGADAVVVATNHSAFEDLLERLPEGTLLVDPWNVTGAGAVFNPVQARVPAE